MTVRYDRLWTGARLATLDPARPALGIVEDGAIASRDGRIAFVGPEAELPTGADAAEKIALDGRWVTPGLVDCHTHLVHAGNRAHEWELRLAGASYEDIARAGGGIASTVRATRAASEDALVASALPRLDRLLAEGVTTVEVKSGYGLDDETEIRMLRAARRLGTERPMRVATSYLGAHALPPAPDGGGARDPDPTRPHAASAPRAASPSRPASPGPAGGGSRVPRTAYVESVCALIPRLAAEGLADAVDAFCETIAFTPDETARVFAAARAAGLPVKLHADQLAEGGGAALAAAHGALSADHLEYASEAGAAAMAGAGTVAVLLPGAFYFLRERQAPPVEAFRRHGVPMAVSTDCNPGSSPLSSLLLAANMAATLFRLTADECVAAITREAARALGLGAEIGTLEAGKACDLAIWDVERPAELAYRIGGAPLHARVFAGR